MGKAIAVVASGVLPLAHFGGTALADTDGLIGTDADDRVVGTDAGDAIAALADLPTADGNGNEPVFRLSANSQN